MRGDLKMGNFSSQMEPPTASQLPDSQNEEQKEEPREEDDAASVASSHRTSGTNHTSASRALARDLEQSVMKSSQANRAGEPPKKRRKRKSARMEEAPEAPSEDAAVSPPQGITSHSDLNQDIDMPSDDQATGENDDGAAQNDTRKHLAREVRRMKKTVLVNSGKAKWAPRINGVKWEVEKLPPSQWPNRKLNTTEKATLARCKAKLKDAKQRLKDFDRDAARNGVGEDAEDVVDAVSEDELAAAGVYVPVRAAKAAVNEQRVTKENPQDESEQHVAAEPLSRKERKRRRKAQRESNLALDADVQMADVKPTNAPQPPLEREPQQAIPPHKKRKRHEPQTMTSSPPQGPAAVVKRPAPRSVGGKHKTELVKTWLSSQGPQDDMESASGRDGSEVPEPSQKRRRVSKHQQENDDEFQADSQGEEDLQAADSDDDLPTVRPTAVRPVKQKQPKKSTRAGKLKQQETPDSSQVDPTRPTSAMSAGPFTADEKSLADSIFSRVLRSEGIDEATLKHQICNWRSAGAFKEEIEAAMPNREKPSIRRFCQRRYHMHERGPWTAEQDEDLRNAQANYPDQWTKLQDLVGRTAQDCKDRWTKHLQFNKKTGPWSRDEEDGLIAAVEHAINTIKNDKSTNPELATDRAALEDAVSWRGIATALGNTRNDKQCREKWAKLKLRENKASADISRQPSRTRAEDEPPVYKKINAAKRKVRSFEIGDFYDIFVEIHTSFDDTHQRYHGEENIIWSIVSQKNRGSRFSLSSKGGMLRRVALEHALQEWKIDSKKVRRKLEKSETLPAKAKVLAKLLEKSYAGRLNSMSRTFLPEMIGKSEDEILRFKADKKKSRAARTKTKKPKVQSKEFVDEIDDEEEVDEAAADDDDDDVIPTTPAFNDDEEDVSDDGRSEDDQSVCQRRLDAQLNGRQDDQEAEEETDLPAVKSQPRRSSAKPKSSISDSVRETTEPANEPAADSASDLVKKESPEEESESVYSPESDDPEKDAEILRRFDVAIKEKEARDMLPEPAAYDSEDEEEDEVDKHEQEEDDDDDSVDPFPYAISPNGVDTPILSRDKFMKTCRE